METMKRATVKIRARAQTRDALSELAAATGQSVPQLLDELAARERDRRLKDERDRHLMQEFIDEYDALDEETRKAYEAELREWHDAPLTQPLEREP